MEATTPTSYSSCFTIIAFVALVFTAPPTSATSRALTDNMASTKFITTYCTNTSYPRVCTASLLPYSSTIQASLTQLTHASITVSLTAARSAFSLVVRLSSAKGSMMPREAAAIGDCEVTMGDAVGRLESSLQAMGMLGGKDAGSRMGDMLTWMSAVVTDEGSCKDGLASGGGERVAMSKVRGEVGKALQLSCNALSFMNMMASKISIKKQP